MDVCKISRSKEESVHVMDLKTPRNLPYVAFYKRSFAYYTMKERYPVILTKIIDTLVRSKENILQKYGAAATDELKNVIGELSKLKYEIQTNKSLRYFNSSSPDAKIYNEYIAKLTGEDGWPTYFNGQWLFVECYIYRRIHEIFEFTPTLKDYDLFETQKKEAFFESIKAIEIMSEIHTSLPNENSACVLKQEFINMLKLNLWGNQNDLSITNGTVDSQTGDPFEVIKLLERYIISDHSDQIWDVVSDERAASQIIDIVLDNAAYELFTDFCIAEYLISRNLAKKVRFYVKTIPWFISDALESDIYWQICNLKNHSNKKVSDLGTKWDNYFKNGTWTVEVHDFWTLPFDYSCMKCVDKSLYKKLGEAKLIIFKGDLNYRKLFGDKNWDPTTPVEEALEGFYPTKLCTLRTVKSDLVVGLKPGLAEKLEAENKEWAYKGDYGQIQFSGRVEH